MASRLQNPLADYASYTYNISLFMITPDAYDAFIASGRKTVYALQNAAANNINPNTLGGAGAYLIAQSGGINNKTSKRGPGFDLDYYIDDLKIDHTLTGVDTGGITAFTNFSFNIYEPYGFSFLTKLKETVTRLKQYYTNKTGKFLPDNAVDQFYILGISFKGWDALGKLAVDKDQLAPDLGNNNGIFERYFDIAVYDLKFKLDGKMTTYNINARSIGENAAFTLKRGLLPTLAPLNGITVKDMLDGPNGLLTKLNEEQQKLLAAGSITFPNTYKVQFLGEGADKIAQATMATKADRDKGVWKSSKAEKTAEVTPTTAKETKPSQRIVQKTFVRNDVITHAIAQLIKESSFLIDAMNVLGTTALENSTKTDSEEVLVTKTQRILKWYSLGVHVQHASWDPITRDFAYDIVYIIRPYETPAIIGLYADKVTPYYGPRKRYDYWYSGKNSEIISYEQTLNSAYFNVVLGSQLSATKTTNFSTNIPMIPGLQQPGDRSSQIGDALYIPNQYVTYLNDPSSWVSAKLSIYGDPDYLMPELPGDINQVYTSFYGSDGFTINANGGQVFIEINFYEASDYDTAKTGTLKINDRIVFWNISNDTKKNIDANASGVRYLVRTVKHLFRGGKFTQELDLTGAVLEDAVGPPTNMQDTRTWTTSTNITVDPITESTVAAGYPDP